MTSRLDQANEEADAEEERSKQKDKAKKPAGGRGKKQLEDDEVVSLMEVEEDSGAGGKARRSSSSSQLSADELSRVLLRSLSGAGLGGLQPRTPSACSSAACSTTSLNLATKSSPPTDAAELARSKAEIAGLHTRLSERTAELEEAKKQLMEARAALDERTADVSVKDQTIAKRDQQIQDMVAGHEKAIADKDQIIRQLQHDRTTWQSLFMANTSVDQHRFGAFLNLSRPGSDSSRGGDTS